MDVQGTQSRLSNSFASILAFLAKTRSANDIDICVFDSEAGWLLLEKALVRISFSTLEVSSPF